MKNDLESMNDRRGVGDDLKFVMSCGFTTAYLWNQFSYLYLPRHRVEVTTQPLPRSRHRMKNESR